MNVLEPVSAELVETPGGIILRVTVEEKWSIFPLPVLFAGSGEITMGLFFIDTNAFGMRDMAVLGGALGSYGWSGFTMYNHSPKGKGAPGFNGIFMYGRQEKENTDRYEKTNREYTTDRLLFSLGINYEFLELLTSSFNISFTDIILNENDDFYNAPENGAMFIGFRPGLSLRRSDWDGFLLSQKAISVNYSYNLVFTGSSFHQVEYRVNFEQPLIPGFRLTGRSAGVWKSITDPLFEDGPQKAQVNILPGSYSSMNYLGASAGLEKYIYRNNWGTLSIHGSWQSVFSGLELSDFEFDHGPSGGILFYLRRVALPAIGINLAYNLISGLYQFGFNMGMAF